MVGLRFTRFLSAGALLAGLIAVVHGTGCGGDFAFQGDLASPDGATAGAFDMGAAPASDLGLGAGTIALTTPAPLASGIASAATFDFDAMLGDAPDRLEAGITVTPRGMQTPLAGAFSWKSYASGYKLTFIPSAPLAEQADFVISVADPRSPIATPLLRTGISTGSHPRVTAVELHGSGGGAGLYLTFRFSEPMAAQSVIAGTSVTGAGQSVSGVTSSDPQDPQSFRFDVAAGYALSSPIVLRIAAGTSGAIALTGVALDPASWDSPTAASDGSFQLSFTNVDLALPGPIDRAWAPTIN